MQWTERQQQRLNKEMEVLAQYFPEFKLTYTFDETHLEGSMKTNLGSQYHLRLYIPRDMPNSIPQVAIVHPDYLTDHDGKRLIDYGQDEAMHLLSPVQEFPCICTYKPTHWNPNLTFYNILIKVRMWLEAYQGHLVTGKPLDHYIKHQL